MKETDGWVKIKKYTDDEGKPVCRFECITRKPEPCAGLFCVWMNQPVGQATPGQTCPVWRGESKSEEEPLPPDLDYYTVVAETQNNPEILRAELLDLIKEVRAWNTRPDSKPYKYENPEHGWKNEDDPDSQLDWESYRDGFNAGRERKEG